MSFFRLPDRLYVFYCPDPTDFIGKLVYTEVKGWYKTVNTTEWGLRICWPLNNFDEALWKKKEINTSTQISMKLQIKFLKEVKFITDQPTLI